MANYDLKIAVRKYFGFDSFKGKQESIITNVLNGTNKCGKAFLEI